MPLDSHLSQFGWLIYIYRNTSNDKNKIPELKKDELLLPPVIIQPTPQLAFLTEFVENQPITPDNVLPVHCFYDEYLERYFDECHNELPFRVEPCGDSSIYYANGLDNAISHALGLEVVTDQTRHFAGWRKTNMIQLPSRVFRDVIPGDVFAFQMTQGVYHFMRVINTDVIYRSMNLQFLKKSPRKINAGDIFVMKPFRGPYVFGRVIRTDAFYHKDGGYYLIYIYRAFSNDKNQIPELRKDNLLVPPIITYRDGWRAGIFEHVTHRPLTPDDVLPAHCFRHHFQRSRYYNDCGEEIGERVEPCGDYAYVTELGIDGRVSDALGLPPT